MTLRTEKEASELWCPLVRIARRETVDPNQSPTLQERAVIVGGCNTDALGRNRVPASCRCIGSQCAMWRWGETETTFSETRKGYCGAAGPVVFS